MVFISRKTCENCNEEYLNENKYCPNCGVKNNDYNSTELIDRIKQDVRSSNFYEEKIDEEIKNIEVPVSGRAKNKFKTSKIKVGNKFHTKENKPKPNQGNKPPKNKVICPNCGTENETSSKFCFECRFPLKNIKICPSCGFISKYEDDECCGECGKKLVDIKICPDCGGIMAEGAKFCSDCKHEF